MTFQVSDLKGKSFLDFWMVILILLVPLILMEVYGFNTLATLICFVQELLEQLSIMLQLVNIDSGSFL